MKDSGNKKQSLDMNVGLVIKTNEGGMWIIPQVEELLSRGKNVVVILPEGIGRLTRALMELSERESGLRIAPVAFDFSFEPGWRTVAGIKKIRKELRTANVDVVLYHLYASALAVRLATLGMSTVRRVHMVAGPLYLESQIIRGVERVLWRLDSKIIAGSEFTRDRYLDIGVDGERLDVIPYGVDTTHFSPTPRIGLNVNRGTESTGKNFVVVMVAYVYAPKSMVFPGVGIKGHDLLLQAWQDFVNNHRDARLLFVGSGFGKEGEEHRKFLIQRTKELGLEKSVTWVESVNDVRSSYLEADLSVSPSLSENHGAALEASAMGVTSIVSDAGALPEALAPGTGWVFPRGDSKSLAKCLEEAYRAWGSGELDTMGIKAREYMIQNFDLSSCVDRVIDVLLDEKKEKNG